jgi:hypothetical protein
VSKLNVNFYITIWQACRFLICTDFQKLSCSVHWLLESDIEAEAAYVTAFVMP